MAFENDKKSRSLGATGMVLGIMVCATVIAVAYIVSNGRRPTFDNTRVDTLERVVGEQSHRLDNVEKELSRLDLRYQHPTGTTEQSRGRAFGSAN